MVVMVMIQEFEQIGRVKKRANQMTSARQSVCVCVCVYDSKEQKAQNKSNKIAIIAKREREREKKQKLSKRSVENCIARNNRIIAWSDCVYVLRFSYILIFYMIFYVVIIIIIIILYIYMYYV